ncbi:magnesium transporter [Pilobolus umbonatus]|nr:magnesium transporter [Pilobolus umbonatus]
MLKAGNILSVLGVLFLFHSAYSTYEHLAYVKAIDEDTTGLPTDIVFECVFSALTALVGIVLSTDTFKPIAMEDEVVKMTIDKIDTKPNFITFNHRFK